MSIPKNKRKEAENTEPFYRIYELMAKISRWIVSDFGIGYKSKDSLIFSKKMKIEDEDLTVLNALSEKYGFTFENSFPQWLLEYYRNRLLNVLETVMHNISDAYSMYPQSMYEFDVRRNKFTEAIINLDYVKVILKEAIVVFPVNLEKYTPFVKEIDIEIRKVKEWRRNANKLKKVCLANDVEYIRKYGGVYNNPGLYYGIIQDNPYIRSLNEYQMQAVANFINGYYVISGSGMNVKSNNMIPCCFITDNDNNIIDYCVK